MLPAARSKIQAFYASFLRLFRQCRPTRASLKSICRHLVQFLRAFISLPDDYCQRLPLVCPCQAHRSRKILGRLGLQLRPSVLQISSDFPFPDVVPYFTFCPRRFLDTRRDNSWITAFVRQCRFADPESDPGRGFAHRFLEDLRIFSPSPRQPPSLGEETSGSNHLVSEVRMNKSWY